MSVKYCKDCKAVFDEEDANVRDCGFYTEFWGRQVYKKEEKIECPDCNSTDIDDAQKCRNCGEYFPPDELDEDGLCPCCIEDK